MTFMMVFAWFETKPGHEKSGLCIRYPVINLKLERLVQFYKMLLVVSFFFLIAPINHSPFGFRMLSKTLMSRSWCGLKNKGIDRIYIMGAWGFRGPIFFYPRTGDYIFLCSVRGEATFCNTFFLKVPKITSFYLLA